MKNRGEVDFPIGEICKFGIELRKGKKKKSNFFS